MKQHGKLAPAALGTIARGAATTGGAFSGWGHKYGDVGWCCAYILLMIVVVAGSFFFMYCGIKTALATQREDDLASAAVSTVAAGLPFVRSAIMKQNLPYAVMLVALDHFHEELNEYRK